MLDAILKFSIQNKPIVALLTIALVAWGAWSLTQLPIDAVPDITNNQVQVLTVAPSQSAQDIERLVTFPVEQTMTTIPQIEEIRSFSRFGLSVVTLVFGEETDPYWARQQVGERLVQAKSLIPEGVGSPELAPMTTGLGEIFQYVLRPKPGYADRYTPMELRTIQDWIVRRQLLGVEGVADVSSFGGYVKQYEIALRPAQLRAMQVSIDEVFNALAANNQNTGGAYIDKRPYAWYIRSEGLVENLEDIRNIQLRRGADGVPVLLRDVAEVQFGNAIRYGAMTHNDEGEVVGAIVLMLKGANSSTVVHGVKERIAAIQKTLPEGVVIEPYLDRAELVDKAIHTVVQNLIEGALIVIFILVLLLGNFRGGLIVASVIPLAMLFAIAMMNLFGVSGNLMSLGAIDFGLIVDATVIIVESIVHALSHRAGDKRLTQLEMDGEVLGAARKIMASAAFGEIIILIVYLPILALVGVEGKMFKPMAQTVSFAIIGAFLLSLTYVPMMSALFLSKRPSHKVTISDRLVGLLKRIYTPSLGLALRWRWPLISSALAALVLAIIVFGSLGAEFIPALEEGDFAVETRVLTGSSMEETIDKSLQAAHVLRTNFPEVEQVVSKIGSSEIPTDPMPIENADLIVVLKEKDQWVSATTREELAEKMHAKLTESVPGVTFGFQQPIQMRFNELMSGARQDVVVKIYGEDLDTLALLADQIGKLASSTDGAKDLYVEQVTGLSQIVVRYDRAQIARFGLDIADLNLALNTAFAGQAAGQVYEGERRFDLVVRLDGQHRDNIDDVRNLPVATPDGQLIPLGQLAQVDFKIGPNQIQRDGARRRIVVGFNVRGRDIESVVEELRAKVESKVDFPDGYYPTYGGTFENLIQARQRLSVAVPVALLMILVLLFFTFKSLKQSLLIFTAIPLSAIGGILALWTRNLPFSISAGVGFIALFGVAVVNGIVLLAEFNRLRATGIQDMKALILEGAASRLRPVIMTAAVASLGFLPMALSHGNGAEVQRPLATVVIGGLVTATLLTLIILPCLYYIFERPLPPVTKEEEPLPLEPTPQGPNQGPGISAIAGLILMFLLGSSTIPAFAQGLTLPQAQAMALRQHSAMKQAGMEVQYRQALQGSYSEIPRLQASLMCGQYNSADKRDNNIALSQQFPFPTILGQRRALSEAQTQVAIAQVAVTENEVLFQLRETWLSLQAMFAELEHSRREEALIAEAERAAAIRYKTGEGTQLDLASATTARAAAQIRRKELQAGIQSHLQLLHWMTGSDEAWTFSDTLLQRLDPPTDSLPAANPQLALMDQQVLAAQRATTLQAHSLLPDLSIGYFNQTLIGTQTRNGQEVYFGPDSRFQGVTMGLSIPLWAKPELAKVQAARLLAEQQQQNRTLESERLALLLRQQFQALNQQANALDWYENHALPGAELIIAQSQKAFQAGEIDYTTHMLHLQQSLATQRGHIQAIHTYNLSILRIHLLAGTFSTKN